MRYKYKTLHLKRGTQFPVNNDLLLRIRTRRELLLATGENIDRLQGKVVREESAKKNQSNVIKLKY